jgi:hypothetical protein
MGSSLLGPLADPVRANQFHLRAARIMEAVANNPGPGEPGLGYTNLLIQLVFLYENSLKDQPAAIPWLKLAARRGSDLARGRLEELGQSW